MDAPYLIGGRRDTNHYFLRPHAHHGLTAITALVMLGYDARSLAQQDRLLRRVKILPVRMRNIMGFVDGAADLDSSITRAT